MDTPTSVKSKGDLTIDEMQVIYDKAKNWQSTLDFHRDELVFFKDLVSKYFILLVSDTKLDAVHKVTTDITEKQKKMTTLSGECRILYHDIGQRIKLNPDDTGSGIRKEFDTLEKDCLMFEKSFRTLKNRVFQLAEYMLGAEKLKLLMA